MEVKQALPLHTMILRVAQAERKALFDASNPTGLTSGQPKVLRYLRNNGWKSQTEIAQNLSIEAPTASRLIESLLREKLIIRKDNEYDKRAYLIAISEKGLEKMALWDAYTENFQKTLFDGFSEEDQLQLRRWLNQLYFNINGKTLDD